LNAAAPYHDPIDGPGAGEFINGTRLGSNHMRSLECAVIGLALCAGLSPAYAEETAVPIHPALNDRFFFGAGSFHPKTATSAEFDSTKLGVGTNIDVEQALGMQTQKSVP
jgi:hypothetical protein